MATRMIQFGHSSDAVKRMVARPRNRREVAEKVIAAAGGRLTEMFFRVGEHDGVGVAEFADNTDAAAASLAIGASGSFSAVKTTVLISMDESVAAMQKAGAVLGAYTPPGS